MSTATFTSPFLPVEPGVWELDILPLNKGNELNSINIITAYKNILKTLRYFESFTISYTLYSAPNNEMPYANEKAKANLP